MNPKYKIDPLTEKKIKILLVLAVIVLSAQSTRSFAQNTATVSVNISTPETFEKCNDLMLIHVPVAAMRQMNQRTDRRKYRSALPISSAGRSGVLIPASFMVTGAAGYTYGTIVPRCITLVKNGHLISICTESANAAGTRVISGTGLDAFFINGSLEIDSRQEDPLHISDDTFPVTVAFN